MLLKYIKNQSVREEVGEWLPSSFSCLNCNECWILMSISPEELCRYCGCAANQHVFLIPREEDVSCTESEQEIISFEKGSSVYGEDFIEEDLDILEDSGIMLQVNMKILEIELYVKPGHFIWDQWVIKWGYPDWGEIMSHTQEIVVMSKKIRNFLMEVGEANVEGNKDRSMYLMVDYNEEKRRIGFSLQGFSLSRLDAINMCIHEEWVGKTALGMSSLCALSVDSQDGSDSAYHMNEQLGKIVLTELNNTKKELLRAEVGEGIKVDMFLKKWNQLYVEAIIKEKEEEDYQAAHFQRGLSDEKRFSELSNLEDESETEEDQKR